MDKNNGTIWLHFQLMLPKNQHGLATSYLQQTPVTTLFNSYCNIEKLENSKNSSNLKLKKFESQAENNPDFQSEKKEKNLVRFFRVILPPSSF